MRELDIRPDEGLMYRVYEGGLIVGRFVQESDARLFVASERAVELLKKAAQKLIAVHDGNYGDDFSAGCADCQLIRDIETVLQSITEDRPHESQSKGGEDGK